jgi:Zn-dependent M28 family amino/carboxypeptidase
MLEAMRILKKVYPNPKRTILVGHWGSEEQGLNGSHAFVEDHPEVVTGLQALFNQDNGTGRIVNLSASGFPAASGHLAQWIAKMPSELTSGIQLSFPGSPSGGGTDHASFVCAGAPGFGLGALGWDYGSYTWHTNRDTFDKIVLDDLKNNATLTAMLAYLASEDDTFVARDRRSFDRGPRVPAGGRGGRGGGGGGGRGGGPAGWPTCSKAVRSAADYSR